MHRQQHAGQPHLLPAAGQIEHNMAIGLAGALSHQRLSALQNLQDAGKVREAELENLRANRRVANARMPLSSIRS